MFAPEAIEGGIRRLSSAALATVPVVREALDGATAFPLMAAAESWPATDWLQPWAPPAG